MRAEPHLSAQRDILLSHYHDMLAHFGRDAGMRLARKHVAWYSRGLPGSAEFRAAVMRMIDANDVIAAVQRFYEPLIEAGLSRAATMPDQEPEALAA
jgi:tRNA-dihydrouridine synthase B